MSKRRRASSGASRGADGDDSDDGTELSNPGPPPSRKKKKLDPLYDTIRSFKKEDGTLLCDAFIRAPKRRQEPQYYEVVSNPIDLLRVKKSRPRNCPAPVRPVAAQTSPRTCGEYTNIADLERDLLLMVIQIRKQELEQHGRGKTSERIRSKRNSRVGPVPTSRALAIMEPSHDDTDHVKTSERTRSKRNSRVGPVPSSRALAIMEPSHDDTDHVKTAEGTCALGRCPPAGRWPSWSRLTTIPTTNSRIGPVPTSRALAIMEPSHDDTDHVKHSDDSGDSDDDKNDNEDSPQLPSRRAYPDYYKEIKNPMSLNQIKNKIRRGNYGNLSEVAGDMNIMFENAKHHRPATMKVFRRPPKNPAPIVDRPSPITTPARSNLPLKKKLHYISRQLVEFTCSDGRQPMLLFMERPSKKLYPEYYNVIDKPIDMIMIENHIKFNEEGSMIYEDASLLERVMTDKLKEISNGGHDRKPPVKSIKPTKSRQLSPFEQKLRTLYDAIRDYRDPKDYYELIKHPIDMEKIAHKLKNNQYHAVSELASDFILMFDNACKYNEPDSQIYKDALILHRVCLQTKQMLRSDLFLYLTR
ncbi:Protein polybromo-1 [Operophtera brumata]|uniref:Protein polybromo-1 n=1 Tax=Operophtera brumata TaxID=104452 RepID=A0A0L7L6D5_OPEBR|nr:Protein polybromo-1 [Operophtera brumata]